MRIVEALLIVAIGAQEPVFQLRVDVPLVSVDVKVLDSRGQPVTSLTAGDFIINEDGVEQHIQDFTPVDTPYNILLLFDRSGSTEDQWTTMQRSADRFIRNLRSQDRVALAAFDDGVVMLSGWDESRDAARQALNELPKRGAGGGTNLYQSLERVAQREFYKTSGRRAIVVLTDGWDNTLFTRRQRGSGLNDPAFQRTASILQPTRVSIYFVALNTDKNPSSSYIASDTLVKEARLRMELLSSISGGGIFFPKSTREVVEIYDQVSRDLSTSYSLAYTSSHPAVQGESHRIEVRVHGANVKQSRNAYVTP